MPCALHLTIRAPHRSDISAALEYDFTDTIFSAFFSRLSEPTGGGWTFFCAYVRNELDVFLPEAF
jgi:hypothetical protein